MSAYPDWVREHTRRYDELIVIGQVAEGARGPHWFEATCAGDGVHDCWSTTGVESVVEDAAHEHVAERHVEFADPHLVLIGELATVSYTAPHEPGWPNLSVSVCGLDDCTGAAVAYVRYRTGRDGLFRLSVPVDRVPSQSALEETTRRVAELVTSMWQSAHEDHPPCRGPSGPHGYGCKYLDEVKGDARWAGRTFAPLVLEAFVARDDALVRVHRLESRLTALRAALDGYGAATPVEDGT